RLRVPSAVAGQEETYLCTRRDGVARPLGSDRGQQRPQTLLESRHTPAQDWVVRRPAFLDREETDRGAIRPEGDFVGLQFHLIAYRRFVNVYGPRDGLHRLLLSGRDEDVLRLDTHDAVARRGLHVHTDLE